MVKFPRMRISAATRLVLALLVVVALAVGVLLRMVQIAVDEDPKTVAWTHASDSAQAQGVLVARPVVADTVVEWRGRHYPVVDAWVEAERRVTYRGLLGYKGWHLVPTGRNLLFVHLGLAAGPDSLEELSWYQGPDRPTVWLAYGTGPEMRLNTFLGRRGGEGASRWMRRLGAEVPARLELRVVER